LVPARQNPSHLDHSTQGGLVPHRMFARTVSLASAGALALALMTAAPAHAAFPGKNGRIVVDADFGKGFELYVLAGDGSTHRRITDFQDGDFFRMPTWKPNGKQIVFNTVAADTGDEEIWTVKPNGTGLDQITHDAGADDLVPRYSYDGSKIVFARAANVASVWTMNADGTGMEQLTGDGYDSFCPTFAPDGRIYFDRESVDNIVAIWVMNADGSGKHRLTNPALRAGCMDVSPDGTKVVFNDNQSNFGPNSIWIMNADGTGRHQLTYETSHHDAGSKFSPNGKKIVFASDRAYPDNCCFDLLKMNVDGKDVVRITSNLTVDGCPANGNCVWPSWGPKPS
jgi:Tol biopolymer transport system component